MPKNDLQARIEEARQRYVASIPGKIALIEAALAQEDQAQLSAIGHRLAGSAGMYGFPAMQECAAALEQACLAAAGPTAVREAAEALLDQLRNARIN